MEEQFKFANELLELARAEETEDGNPMTAVRHYTTAMEIIASAASQVAGMMYDGDQRRFFLFQIRTKLILYYERAVLLLQVANGMGLLDKPPTAGGGPMMAGGHPPALYSGSCRAEQPTNMSPPAKASNNSSAAVLGIPIQPPAGVPSSEAPPMSCYISSDDTNARPPPPPITPPVDLDELMRNLGAPPDA